MILEELDKKQFIEKLVNAEIEISEAKKEISILLSEFGENNLKKINDVVEERVKTRRPLQYLLGKTYFMDFEVSLNEHVLIPRPETEILVEETIRKLDKLNLKKIKALDIGCGSGVIGIALCKMLSGLECTSIDISEEAINLASKNAKNINVETNILFKKLDIFSNDFEKFIKENIFDLIISNPPYISKNTYEQYVSIKYKNNAPSEISYEPKSALYGTRDNLDGLVYYEKIISLFKISQAKLLALEIDPEITNGLKEILEKNNLINYDIIKDYGKLDRCLFVFL